jgi:amino acid adenylation domain-containing protein
MKPNRNLAFAVHHFSRQTPGAVCIADNKSSLTYRDVAQRAARLAAALRLNALSDRHDGEPARIGILGSRSMDACVGVLGACWSGATYVPIGPKLPEDRVLAILAQCNLSAIIAAPEGVHLLTEKVLSSGPSLIICPGSEALACAPPGVKIIDSAEVFSTSVDPVSEPVPVRAEDNAYIIFTSGTTGIPKGVMIAYSAVNAFIDTMSELLCLTSEDRVLETCELTFDVSVHNMFVTWCAGAALYVLPPTQIMNAIKYVRTHALTVWNSVPSLVGMLRQIKALAPGSMPSMRKALFAGESLTVGIVDSWRAAAPNSTVYDLYGPTEATVFCMLQIVGDPPLLTPGRDLIAIGKALPGCEAAVVDEKGNKVPDGTQGELAIAGVQLAKGYLNAPEQTATRFPTINGKRWYLTGDQAMRDPNGVFHCFGRLDNQIKVLGNRVEIEEIEAHLRKVTGAEMVGVIAHPVVDGVAQGLVGFIGATQIDSPRVVAELKTRLPAYMVPGRVIALEHMPTNQNGKVDRKALRSALDATRA